VVVAGCASPDPLLQPRPVRMTEAAPDSFLVVFETTQGSFTIKARRQWAPAGVDRFFYLVRHRYYDGVRFFRVLPGFVAQFGLSSDPAVAAVWADRFLPDDSVRASNRRGTVSFARGRPNSRTTQLFVNLRDNARLDTLGGFGFAPVGEVVAGMAVVDSLHGGYGEQPPQDSIRLQGEAFLARRFPELDRIQRARVTIEWRRRR